MPVIAVDHPQMRPRVCLLRRKDISTQNFRALSIDRSRRGG